MILDTYLEKAGETALKAMVNAREIAQIKPLGPKRIVASLQPPAVNPIDAPYDLTPERIVFETTFNPSYYIGYVSASRGGRLVEERAGRVAKEIARKMVRQETNFGRCARCPRLALFNVLHCE